MKRAAITILLFAASAHAQDDLTRVAAHVRAGEDDAAIAALSAMTSPRARYLRGRLLERNGRLAEAAAVYPIGPDAAPLPDEIERDAASRRAIALARSGECAAARAALAPRASEAMTEARIAECLLAEGNHDAAIGALRRVMRRGARDVDQFAVRLALAEALARDGQRDDAGDVLLDLAVERPEHPEASVALSALETLRGPVTFTFEQRMRRAEQLHDARRYMDAIAELDAAGRPRRRPELRRWVHLYGMSLYDARRRYEDAAALLSESAELRGPHAVDDEFTAARALSRANRDSEAVIGYRRFAEAHADHAKAAEAMYLAAWLEIRHEVRGAERRMQQFARSALARRAPGFQREAHWHLALRAFTTGRHTQAARLFTRYAESSNETLVRGRGLYWSGRAYQEAGDRTRALAAYREVLHLEPLHWYALLSRQRIVELGEEPGAPFPDPPLPARPPVIAPALPELARFYADLGLDRDARAVLAANEQPLRSNLDGLIAVYAELGDASRTRRLAANARLLRSRAQPGPADRFLWDAAYPRPWPDRVRASAAAFHLAPAHLYAIMWQESGFDPDAVSYADAIGLMQLLPATAERVASEAGTTVSRDMLFDPGTNIRLGAAYVGRLAERFGIPLAFAAFNGGGNRVQEWLEARGETDLDLFVELIPFEQTRNYTRRVTTHLAHYLYLEDPARGWPPIDLPARVAPRP
jgi:soluble lytic murein transglycosylase